VILNLYPVEHEQIAHVAFEYGLRPCDVARFWDKVSEKWVVRLGYGHTVHALLYEGDSLDEAFDAICSAPTNRSSATGDTAQSGRVKPGVSPAA
jgi:hypothetical protein